MEKSLRRGDLVRFYDGGYSGRVINEDGEMEVWDWHLYSSGRILTVFENEVLVFLYSTIDENPAPFDKIIIEEVSIIWLSTRKLELVSRSE